MNEIFWFLLLIVSMLLTIWRPLIGFCMVYPMLLLCPLRFSGLGIVHTPFGIMVVFTALVALIQRKAVGRWLYSSPILVPMVLLVSVLLIFRLVEYGDPAAIAFRIRTYLMGLWPLVLAWLILRKPSDVRAIMLAALISSLVLAVEVLWVVMTKGQEFLVAGAQAVFAVRELEEQGASLSYLTMIALALCSPVWLSLLLDGGFEGKRKLFVAGALGATAFCVLLSTYSSALVALILGTGLVFVTRWRRVQGGLLKYSWGVLLVGLLLLGGWLLASKLPVVQHTFERISNPEEDFSGAFRIVGILDESKAFLESPLIGHGVAETIKYTPGGHLLAGHNSITRDAASFGLLFVLPFSAVLVIIGRQYLRLKKKVHAPADAAILGGMFVSYLVSILIGVITITFGDLMQDTFFWTFTAAMLYWNRWADMHPGEQFFAWR